MTVCFNFSVMHLGDQSYYRSAGGYQLYDMNVLNVFAFLQSYFVVLENLNTLQLKYTEVISVKKDEKFDFHKTCI